MTDYDGVQSGGLVFHRACPLTDNDGAYALYL